MMQSFWKPSQQVGSSPTILDYVSVSFLKLRIWASVNAYHDRGQKSCSRPGFHGVAHLFDISGGLGGFIRVCAHTVVTAVCTVAVGSL
jgi:hypothetical protein